MASAARLRLPDPGSFEDLLRPTRIEVASLVRFACERRKTLLLADLTGAALKALGRFNVTAV